MKSIHLLPSLRVLTPFLAGICIHKIVDHADVQENLIYSLFYSILFLTIALCVFHFLSVLNNWKSFLAAIVILISGFMMAQFNEPKEGRLINSYELIGQPIIVENVTKQTEEKVQFGTYINGSKYYCFLKKCNREFLVTGDELLIKTGRIQELNSSPYHLYLKQQGYSNVLFISDKDYSFQSSNGNIISFFEEVKYYLISKILAPPNIERRDAAILITLTLGDKSFLESEEKNNFKLAGAMHILAISGLHVGILYFGLSQLLKRIFVNKPWILLLHITVILVAYAFIAGLSASVTRAVLMCLIIQLSIALEKNAVSLNILFFTAIITTLWDPSSLWQLGFQLSYVATLFILLCLQEFRSTAQPFHYEYDNRIKKQILRWTGKYIVPYFSISLYATLGTLPLLLYHFEYFQFSSLFSGIVVIPISAIIIYGSLLSYLFVGHGEFFGPLIELCSSVCFILRNAVEMFAHHSNWTLNYSFSLFDLIVYYCCLGGLLITKRSPKLTFTFVSLLTVIIFL